jgi:hypothetical protein
MMCVCVCMYVRVCACIAIEEKPISNGLDQENVLIFYNLQGSR